MRSEPPQPIMLMLVEAAAIFSGVRVREMALMYSSQAWNSVSTNEVLYSWETSTPQKKCRMKMMNWRFWAFETV